MHVFSDEDLLDLQHAIFIYRRPDNSIVAAYLGHTQECNDAGWEHIATINPRLWVEAHWDTIETVRDEIRGEKPLKPKKAKVREPH